jgi:hypothetical protein
VNHLFATPVEDLIARTSYLRFIYCRYFDRSSIGRLPPIPGRHEADEDSANLQNDCDALHRWHSLKSIVLVPIGPPLGVNAIRLAFMRVPVARPSGHLKEIGAIIELMIADNPPAHQISHHQEHLAHPLHADYAGVPRVVLRQNPVSGYSLGADGSVLGGIITYDLVRIDLES